MTAIPHSPTPFLAFIAEGQTTPVKDSGPNGATLASGTIYYAEAGGDAALIQSIQVDWDAAAILTITVEDSNWDAGSGTGQATSAQAAGRAWVPENPSSGYVGVSGGTAVGLTVTVAGGTAGTCMFNLGNLGARRVRVKVDVGGTGGNVQARAHAKM